MISSAAAVAAMRAAASSPRASTTRGFVGRVGFAPDLPRGTEWFDRVRGVAASERQRANAAKHGRAAVRCSGPLGYIAELVDVPARHLEVAVGDCDRDRAGSVMTRSCRARTAFEVIDRSIIARAAARSPCASRSSA
jgi:hypothetical protein